VLAAGTAAVVMLLGGVRAATPAAEPEPEPTLQEEVARLNASLERIVQRMDEFLGGQQADLLMKRLEIHQSRLAPTEALLERSRRMLEDIGEELEIWKSRHAIMENDWEEQERSGNPPSDAEKERMNMEFQSHYDLLLSRQEAEYRRSQELENDLAASREDMAILEEMLDEKLGLR
jgi:hypothetical protein